MSKTIRLEDGVMRWFWVIYRFFWWRWPSNRKRFRELLIRALQEDEFIFEIRHITTGYWFERIRKPDRWSKEVMHE